MEPDGQISIALSLSFYAFVLCPGNGSLVQWSTDALK